MPEIMKEITNKILTLSISMLLISCSTGTKPAAQPEEIPVSGGDFETVVIAGTNDIHGSLAPIPLRTRETEGHSPTSYEAGGAAMLGAYLEEFRQEFGSRFLWLDAGDEFQGSIESNSVQGASMVDFFNSLELKAAAIGNHEFDYGSEKMVSQQPSTDLLGALKARMKQAHYPYLTANTYDRNTGKLVEFPNTFPSVILNAGRVKVGVIGLTTLDAATTTLPEYVRSLKFGELKDAALREARKLREEGAQVIVLDAHAGLQCDPGRTPGYRIRKPTDPQGECASSDEIVQLLTSLPPGTVDAVVSGHTHTIVHHWVSGVPVIQGGASGRYTNLIYLTYDLKEHKLVSDRSRIEGPIPICPLVFQNQGDCNGDRPAPKSGRGPLVAPRFHGKVLSPDPKTAALLKPVFEKSAQLKAEVVGHAARPIEHRRTQESELGNLVADAIRAATHSDFALMNSGGIRISFDAGPITFGEVFRALPFDNSLVVLTLKGSQLKAILRVAESGSRGFPAVSGLRLRLLDLKADAPSSDLNGDGKIEPWEINRLIEAREASLPDGELIQDHKTYTLATLDFLLMGGDDMEWPMSRISKEQIHMTPILTRDAVINYIKAAGPNYAFNSADHPLVSPTDPRLKFETPKSKATKGKKAKRSHRRRRR